MFKAIAEAYNTLVETLHNNRKEPAIFKYRQPNRPRPRRPPGTYYLPPTKIFRLLSNFFFYLLHFFSCVTMICVTIIYFW